MKLNLKKQLPEVIGIGAGAVGAGFLTSKLPIANPKIKAAVPLVLGLVLSGKSGAIGNIGKGMIAAGAQQLASSLGIGAVDSTIIGQIDELDLSGVNSTIIGGTGRNDDSEAYYGGDQP